MMQSLRWRLALGAGVLFLAGGRALAAAPDVPAGDSPAVEVSYRDPTAIAELNGPSWRRNSGLDELKAYIVKRAAAVVPPGDHLAVTVTDVRFAGMVEPWRGPDFQTVRIVREITPPRIDLAFQLVGPGGAVLKEGSRELRDINFLGRLSYYRDEPLPYEKNLIDDWLQRDFGARRP